MAAGSFDCGARGAPLIEPVEMPAIRTRFVSNPAASLHRPLSDPFSFSPLLLGGYAGCSTRGPHGFFPTGNFPQPFPPPPDRRTCRFHLSPDRVASPRMPTVPTLVALLPCVKPATPPKRKGPGVCRPPPVHTPHPVWVVVKRCGPPQMPPGRRGKFRHGRFRSPQNGKPVSRPYFPRKTNCLPIPLACRAHQFLLFPIELVAPYSVSWVFFPFPPPKGRPPFA